MKSVRATRTSGTCGLDVPAGWRDQPILVTCKAVVQLFLMALRAADRVMVPAQTAFFLAESVTVTPAPLGAWGRDAF